MKDRYVTILKMKTGEIIPLELIEGSYHKIPLHSSRKYD